MKATNIKTIVYLCIFFLTGIFHKSFAQENSAAIYAGEFKNGMVVCACPDSANPPWILII